MVFQLQDGFVGGERLVGEQEAVPAFSQLQVLALRRMKGPSCPIMPFDPLWTSATLVVDVVGRAGWIVTGINGQHEFGLLAKSIVRLLYVTIFYPSITTS